MQTSFRPLPCLLIRMSWKSRRRTWPFLSSSRVPSYSICNEHSNTLAGCRRVSVPHLYRSPTGEYRRGGEWEGKWERGRTEVEDVKEQGHANFSSIFLKMFLKSSLNIFSSWPFVQRFTKMLRWHNHAIMSSRLWVLLVKFKTKAKSRISQVKKKSSLQTVDAQRNFNLLLLERSKNKRFLTER